MASEKLTPKAKKIWAKSFGAERYGTLETGQTVHRAAFMDELSQYGWELFRDERYNPARIVIVKAVTVTQEQKDAMKSEKKEIEQKKLTSDQFRKIKHVNKNRK